MIIALRFLNPQLGLEGGYQEVSENDLESYDPDFAHAAHFVCARAGCGIRLFAVMPLETGRRQHFRTRKNEAHIGHGGAGLLGSSEVLHFRGNSLGEPPQIWRDPSSRVRGEISGGVSGIAAKLEAGQKRGDRSGNKKARNREPIRTSSLPTLVSHWKAGQPSIRGKPFKMRKSGASTWGELFVSVGSPAAEASVDSGYRRILYGPVEKVEAYGGFNFKLTFAARSSGKYTSCYLQFDPDMPASQERLYEELGAAVGSFRGNAYILGKIVLWNQSPSVEADSLLSIFLDNDSLSSQIPNT